MTLVHKFCCPRKLEASFRGSINLAWSFISLLCQFSSELHFMAYFNLTDLTWVCSGGGLGAQLWLVLHICAGTCILGSHLLGFRAKHILNPWRTYCKLSAVLISHGLTKGSLMFPNYPAQIMFKSTKVVQPQVLECFFPLHFCVVLNQDLVEQFFFLGLGLKHGRMDFRSCCRMLRMNFGVTTLCVGGGSFALWAGIASNGNGRHSSQVSDGSTHVMSMCQPSCLLLVSWSSPLQHPGSGHGCCSTCVGCLCGKLSGGHFFEKPCYNSGIAFCPPSRLA